VSATRQIWTNPSRFVVVVRMKAEETRADWTRAHSRETYLLYTAPAGCSIADEPGNFASNGYLPRAFTPDPRRLAAGDEDTFVRRFKVFADRDGNDVGNYTSVRVFTKGFNITLHD
jgi:hypothetical protein